MHGGRQRTRLDLPRSAIDDARDTQQIWQARCFKLHAIAGLQRKQPRSQGEAQGVAADPRISKRHIGEALRRGAGHHRREFEAELAMLRRAEALRRDARHAIVDIAIAEAERNFLRQVGFRCMVEMHEHAIRIRHEIVAGNIGHDLAAGTDEFQRAACKHRIETK